MKKTGTLIPVFLSIVLSTPLAFSQQKEHPPVKLEMISERLYEIQGGRGARGGMYIGENGVLLVDAKMDKIYVDQTITEIRKLTDKPIKYLVNTHSDNDHIKGNRFFPSSITFISHENCRDEFFKVRMSGKTSDWDNPELTPYLPSITFSDKMDIYLGSNKVELWYFGVGHTTGDTVVYFPEEKTAFVGDQVFFDRPQLIHSFKGGNSFENVKTLEKMLSTLDADKFQNGHSDIADRKMIQEHINTMKSRQNKIASLISKKKELDEIKSEFEEKEGKLVGIIYNEITSKRN